MRGRVLRAPAVLPCLLVLLACAAQPDGSALAAECVGQLSSSADPQAQASAFVVLPDTQFYACAYPDIFVSQGEWLALVHRSEGIALALHTGDIVDASLPAQWQVAADALHRLDGVLPYMLTPGNHDLDTVRGTLLDRYFDLADLGAASGARLCERQRGVLANSFAIVRLRGEPWLFIGLELGPRDATLDWANRVLAEHRALPAVLFTHAYLYSDGKRYDRAIVPPQPYHPDIYGVTPSEGINDGQDIWERVIEPNENVRLVLSGHVLPDGVARASSRRRSGSVVHEVLTNYQTCDLCPCEPVEGGGGYLRIFRLEDGGAFHVVTYSPYRDAYLRDPENEFDLPKTPL